MKLVTRVLFAVTLMALWALPARAQTEADSVLVTFQLDATDLVTKCQLGGTSTKHVEVRGDFNNWGHSDKYVLADNDGDKIYTVTVKIHKGDFGYKFAIHGAQDIWENDPNRTISLTENVTVPVTTFNKGDVESVCGATEKCVEAQFQVDMAGMILSGGFDPATEQVAVAGGFNGWGEADVLTKDNLNPTIYTKIVKIATFSVPGTIEYKFREGVAGAMGWEGGSNHTVAVTGTEEEIDGCLQVDVPVRYYNNVSPADLFGQASTVNLEIDARPGFYMFADSAYINGDATRNPALRQTTFDKKIFVNGPLMGGALNTADEWHAWGKGEDLLSEELDRMAYDDGTHGDVTANDTIYTIPLTFAQGKARNYIFKLSMDGYDNENPAQHDHYIQFADQATQTIRVTFGAPRQEDGTFNKEEDFLYFGQYLEVSQDNQTVTVVRHGTAVAAEDEEFASGTALGQNYPNPVRGATRFEYTLTKPEYVSVRVYDLMGRVVATLVDGPQSAATHEVSFNTSGLPSGVYVYRLETAGKVISKTMVVVK